MWFYLLCTVLIIVPVAFGVRFLMFAIRMARDEQESERALGKWHRR